MGLLGKLFGITQGQPYVDAGTALTRKFCRELNLPGWKDDLPEYTPEELQAIAREFSQFQSIANKELGGNAAFHPDIADDLKRSLAGSALQSYASTEAMGLYAFYDDEEEEEAERPDWRPVASTFLKAWAARLDPMVMIELGDCLSRLRQREAARDAYKVVLHLPSYARTLWGPGHDDLARDNVKLAKEGLAALESLSELPPA